MEVLHVGDGGELASIWMGVELAGVLPTVVVPLEMDGLVHTLVVNGIRRAGRILPGVVEELADIWEGGTELLRQTELCAA